MKGSLHKAPMAKYNGVIIQELIIFTSLLIIKYTHIMLISVIRY